MVCQVDISISPSKWVPRSSCSAASRKGVGILRRFSPLSMLGTAIASAAENRAGCTDQMANWSTLKASRTTSNQWRCVAKMDERSTAKATVPARAAGEVASPVAIQTEGCSLLSLTVAVRRERNLICLRVIFRPAYRCVCMLSHRSATA